MENDNSTSAKSKIDMETTSKNGNFGALSSGRFPTPPSFGTTTDEIAKILENNTFVESSTANSSILNAQNVTWPSGNLTTTPENDNWLELPFEIDWLWFLIGMGAVVCVLGVVALILIWKLCGKNKEAGKTTCKVVPCKKSEKSAGRAFSAGSRKGSGDDHPATADELHYRKPLPPIGTSQSIIAGEMDGYQGSTLPPRRLAPIERAANVPGQGAGRDLPKYGLKGVPMLHVPANKHRPLPP